MDAYTYGQPKLDSMHLFKKERRQDRECGYERSWRRGKYDQNTLYRNIKELIKLRKIN